MGATRAPGQAGKCTRFDERSGTAAIAQLLGYLGRNDLQYPRSLVRGEPGPGQAWGVDSCRRVQSRDVARLQGHFPLANVLNTLHASTSHHGARRQVRTPRASLGEGLVGVVVSALPCAGPQMRRGKLPALGPSCATTDRNALGAWAGILAAPLWCTGMGPGQTPRPSCPQVARHVRAHAGIRYSQPGAAPEPEQGGGQGSRGEELQVKWGSGSSTAGRG